MNLDVLINALLTSIKSCTVSWWAACRSGAWNGVQWRPPSCEGGEMPLWQARFGCMLLSTKTAHALFFPQVPCRGSEARAPPAHLSPLPPPNTKKKRKKKKHRERLESPYEGNPHPMPPPRGYVAPVQPPPHSAGEGDTSHHRETSPPGGYSTSPQQQKQPVKVRGQSGKPAPKQRITSPQREQRWATLKSKCCAHS